ncbi:DUF1588 domain-containing protein [Verrucomicrobiales bacterium]|nr:DUF1588 domain-containing protein [Verrucomicrobiales bacterium]
MTEFDEEEALISFIDRVSVNSYRKYQIMLRPFLIHVICALLMISATTSYGGPALAGEVSQQAFIEKHCIECHDSDTEKGGFNIEPLTSVTAANTVEWQKVWEQVSLKEMPPTKKEQPVHLDRMHFVNGVIAGLQEASKNQGGFHENLLPTKGNYVDHELLFSDAVKVAEPPSTPSRMWRIHPAAYLVKLNELVHNTPEYNPKYPGQLASGDPVMVSKVNTDTGDLRLSLGSDQVMGIRNGSGWTGDFPSVRPVQSLSQERGLQDFAVMYEVTSDEMQLLVTGAKAVLKHMIVGSDVPDYMWRDPEKYKLSRTSTKIVDGKKQTSADRESTHLYIKGYQRKYSPFMDIMETEVLPTQAQLEKLVPFLFKALTGRHPRVKELNEQISFIQNEVKALGKVEGLIVGCAPIFLHPEALYRYEFGSGEPDPHGRVMLAGDELANSIAGALTYMSPDPQLQAALKGGELKTREDVLREVTRIMDDGSIRKPRILRFFQEYFDYHRAPSICKDTQSLKAVGVLEDGNYYNLQMNYLVSETDRLIEYILESDRDVLRELLTTDKSVVRVRPTIKEDNYFNTFNDAKSISFYDNTVSKYRKKDGWTKSETGIEDIERPIFIREYWVSTSVTGPSPWEMLTFPATERCGILTQPSWLIAHSDAMDNHAVFRGRWIRERLLGGGVPEVPITVDAVLPDEPKESLRHRMRVTRAKECWRCHQKMDPLGLPFEMFNHVGKFRKTKDGKQVDENGNPVDASGEIIASGVPELDGKVEDAFELIHRLANSEHVEQVFVRHAFRYWMGRNETINDAPTLQAAHKAYQDNGGSMKALIISLLTSDSFLYRKPVQN